MQLADQPVIFVTGWTNNKNQHMPCSESGAT